MNATQTKPGLWKFLKQREQLEAYLATEERQMSQNLLLLLQNYLAISVQIAND